MANCLISLGSNRGDRGAQLQSALNQLAELPQTKLLAQSSFRDTRPAGGPVQDPYLNAAATIETSLDPSHLLAELQRIENNLGRVREERWGPRTIDLDLLLYDQLEWNTPELTLPHPRMSFRRFVLEPANEIAAEMVYPINGWTIRQLVQHLDRRNRLIVLQSAEDAKTELGRELSRVQETQNWRILDRLESNQVGSSSLPSLVVIWQPKLTAELESLDRDRRLKTSPPSLWLPGVSLEQARQEVIAAMAAME